MGTSGIGGVYGSTLAMWLGILGLLVGCAPLPPPAPSAAAQRGVHLTAAVIAPEIVAEWLEDTQAAQRIVAVAVSIQNVGAEALAIVPSRLTLVGPRNRRIRPVEPASLSAYSQGAPWQRSISTPPYVGAQQDSGGQIATIAGERALRARVLAPGDTGQGWLYFPIAGRRAAEEVAQRWLLAVALQDQQQRWREHVIRVEPPDEPSR